MHRSVQHLLVGACLAHSIVFAQDSSTAKPEGTGCARHATASEMAANLKGTGMTRSAIKEELVKVGYTQHEAEMGAAATFMYPELKDYAMSDLIGSYCGMLVASKGRLTEMDKMMIGLRFQITSECAKSGRTEKGDFLRCYNEKIDEGRKASAPVSK